MRFSTVFFAFMLWFAPMIVRSCNNNNQEVGGPFPNEYTAQRVFSYDPATPAAQSSYPTNTLKIVQYNILSGYSYDCQYSLDSQLDLVASEKPHFFAAQEISVGVSSRCGCVQPQLIANRLGMYTNFFRTFFFQDGMYGHGNAGIYKPATIRSLLFNKWSTERRGLIAQVTYPPQFNGRATIIVSAHFQYDDEETRQGQAVETISFVQGLLQEFPGAIVIVPGDFYTEVGQGAYSIMLSYFQNSWNEYNGDRSGGFTHPSPMPTNRFDHVWFKAPADLQMYVKDFKLIGGRLSDHLALSVTFGFPSNPSTPPPTTSTPAPASGCAAVITGTARTSEGSSWMDGGLKYNIYDVLVKNTGTCALRSLSLSMTLPSGTSISSAWNIDQTSGAVTLGGEVPAGGSFSGAGVILSGNTLPSTFTFQVGSVNCGATCSAGPTSPPTATSPPVAGSCNVAISYGSATNPLIITNSGSKAVKSLVLSFSPSLPDNNWNLIKSSSAINHFTIPDFGYQGLSSQGQSYSSSGFYTSATPPTVSVVSVSC